MFTCESLEAAPFKPQNKLASQPKSEQPGQVDLSKATENSDLNVQQNSVSELPKTITEPSAAIAVTPKQSVAEQILSKSPMAKSQNTETKTADTGKVQEAGQGDGPDVPVKNVEQPPNQKTDETVAANEKTAAEGAGDTLSGDMTSSTGSSNASVEVNK